MLAVPPMVGPDRFSYPFSADWHIVAEVFFALQHLTLLAGVVGLAAYCGRYGSRLVRAGLVVTGLGVVTLVGCEVLAATAAYEPSDSPWAMTVGSFYGVAMLLIGVGLVIAGLVIARRRMLTGWARWITLATGGYVFVILFPAVFGPNVAGRLAIGGWMLGLGGHGLGRCPGRARRRRIPRWLAARLRAPYDRSALRAGPHHSHSCFHSVLCAGWPGRLRCAVSWPRSPEPNQASLGRGRSAGSWLPAS